MLISNPFMELDLPTLRQRRSMKWARYPDDVLPLWVAEMDTALAPPIRDTLRAAVDIGDTGYADPGGLAQAYAGFSGARFGWAPDPKDMLLAGDVAQGMISVLRVVTSPGDAVILNTPAYPPFFPDIVNAGRRICESPLACDADGRYRLDLDRLERDVARSDVTAYVLVNPHNPTGVVLSREELTAVAELCDRHGVRVLADEIHAPLTYPGPFVPYLSVPGTDRDFALVAASKAWNLAGLKSAMIVAGGQAAAEALRRIPEEAQYTSGLLGVLASEVALRDGVAWLDAVLSALDTNRSLLARLLEEYLPQVHYRPPAATYLAWLDCRDLGLAGEPAEFFLEQARVAVNAGPSFGPGGAGFVRLNFATSPTVLETAVARMARAVNRRPGSPRRYS